MAPTQGQALSGGDLEPSHVDGPAIELLVELRLGPPGSNAR
jgi:hypothetical protein